MKKGKRIWNKVLSLMLCLVMVTGMFVGMEVKAASQNYGFRFFCQECFNKTGKGDISGTAKIDGVLYSTGATVNLNTSYHSVEMISVEGDHALTKSDGKNVPVNTNDPLFTWKLNHKSRIIVLVKDQNGNPISGKTVYENCNGKSGTTNPDGKYVIDAYRPLSINVTVRDPYGDISENIYANEDNHTLEIIVPQRRLVKVNVKSETGESLNGYGNVGSEGGMFDLNSEGVYERTLNVGENYTVKAEGFSGYNDGSITLDGDDTNAELTLSLQNPDLKENPGGINNIKPLQELTLKVGESVKKLVYISNDVRPAMTPAPGGTYTWESTDPTIFEVTIGNATIIGTPVTIFGKLAGTANLKVTVNSHGASRSTTIPVTVSKADPVLTVSVPNFIYGECDKNIVLQSNVSGTFIISGENTVKVSANEEKVLEANTLIGDAVKGEHTLNYTFKPDETNKYNEKSGIASYVVEASDLSDATVTYKDSSLIYDGTAKTLNELKVIVDNEVELQPGVDYTVAYKNNVKAGNTATVEVTGKGNYTGKATNYFNIQKAPLYVSNATAQDRQYDGTNVVKITDAEFQNIVAGEKEKVIDFSNATAKIVNKNVGIYSGVTNLTGIQLKNTDEAKNYTLNMPGEKETISLATDVIISKKDVIIEMVVIKPTKVYDGGTSAEITNKGSISENFDGDKLFILQGIANYENKNVGTNKTVSFSNFALAGDEKDNYNLTAQPAAETAVITQKTLGLVSDSANVKDKLYDGTTGAEFSEIPELVQNDLIENDQVVLDYSTAPVFNEIGSADEERSVKVTTNLKITGADAGNYSLQIPEVSAMIKNYTAINGTDYSVNSNEWINEDFVIAAGNGCYVSEGSTVDSEWAKSLTVTCEDNKSNVGTKAFYVKNANGKISRVVNDKNAEYKIDKIAPTGTVTFTEAQTPWTEFIETISFGLFYKDAQEVVITSQDQDGLSGVASVEWYESLNKGMTLEEVEAITNWKEYKGNLIVALEDTKKFVYYVKITDYAGNVTYLSTDGAVYDITNPAITGIVNGETYYTSQVANVSDVNLDTITFNGNSVSIVEGGTTPVALEGNVDATYTITAVDKAKNTTTVTITMKPLSELSGDITDKNVALSDEKELEKSKEILEIALKEENLSKLSGGEEDAIREKLIVIQNLLQDIDEVKQVIKLLKNLPSAYVKDGAAVNPYVSDRMDDEEQKLYSAVKAAYKAYDKLSSHQQSLISTSLKHNLSDLRKILTDYRIIDGSDKVWVYDTNGTLTFTANGPVVRFTAAFVDGKKVPADEMKVTKGSTVVELDAGYLYSLGLGDHIFQMEYEDGKTDVVEFSIVTMEEWNAMSNQQSGSNKTVGVATGDSANILLWGAALILGAAGLAVVNKKRKNEEA